ncbi:DUF6507 family protein [Arthrobacter sp. AOP36-A1-22]|uniref:DUF6507 family protein n=1 Tax=unclassified Arthrobacter TaxID=235627 RepID=UPI00403357D4
MSLDDYQISVVPFRAVLSDLDTNLGDLDVAKKPLDTSLEDCKEAVKGTVVTSALDRLNARILLANTEAALTRGRNAHSGASKIADAYITSDEKMASDARQDINKVPDFHEPK